MDGMWPAMGLGMLLVWVLVVAGIVAAVVLVVRAVQGPASRSADDPGHALRILEERFARGEIDRDEFEERRRILGS